MQKIATFDHQRKTWLLETCRNYFLNITRIDWVDFENWNYMLFIKKDVFFCESESISRVFFSQKMTMFQMSLSTLRLKKNHYFRTVHYNKAKSSTLWVQYKFNSSLEDIFLHMFGKKTLNIRVIDEFHSVTNLISMNNKRTCNMLNLTGQIKHVLLQQKKIHCRLWNINTHSKRWKKTNFAAKIWEEIVV